jgi:TP901 family phage tail tape measure protein
LEIKEEKEVPSNRRIRYTVGFDADTS